MVIYCPNLQCCQPNEYSLKVPTFCGYCGTNLTKDISRAAVKPAQPPKPQSVTKPKPKQSIQSSNIAKLRKNKVKEVDEERDEDSVEYENDASSVPEIEQLDYDIVGNRPKLTFADLAKQPKTGFTPRPIERISREEAIKQFQNEAKGKGDRIELGDDE